MDPVRAERGCKENLRSALRKKLGLTKATGAAAGRNKYGAKAVVVDGIRFASQAEAKRYQQLVTLMRANLILWFCRQPRFVLPGGVEYVADFIVVDVAGSVWVEDVKGVKTPTYRLKAKQLKALYGIEVIEP